MSTNAFKYGDKVSLIIDGNEVSGVVTITNANRDGIQGAMVHIDGESEYRIIPLDKLKLIEKEKECSE